MWSIAEVARIAGTTSRTLRHYDDVGLLAPSRVGANGYRYYDSAALRRLQRILLLRQLGLGLPAIATLLDAPGSADEAGALRTHLRWLRQERDRLDRQIASVERTISGIEDEEQIMAEQMFDGFDHAEHKEEVSRRWGAQAWADSDRWWRELGPDGRDQFTEEHREIAQRWAQLQDSGVCPGAPEALANARRHHAWIGASWGGRAPTAEELAGLADMYVADDRFAANYGGAAGAQYVRDALIHYAITELT